MHGVIGFLITDRDAALVPVVFFHLEAALATFKLVASQSNPSPTNAGASPTIDLVVSVRERDRKAQDMCRKYVPATVRSLVFLITEYDARFDTDHQNHSSAGLEAICNQRNRVCRHAAECAADWLFFLDSDVFVQENTLALLWASGRWCVGAPYVPRWSYHAVVGVMVVQHDCETAVHGEVAQMQLLVNPHCLAVSSISFPCSVMGCGAMLLRSAVFHVPFRLGETLGGVRGEDVGFCLDLCALGMQQELAYPHCLSRHVVRHEAGGQHPDLFVPRLQVDSSALLTQIRTDQLFDLRNRLQLHWLVQPDKALHASSDQSGRRRQLRVLQLPTEDDGSWLSASSPLITTTDSNQGFSPA